MTSCSTMQANVTQRTSSSRPFGTRPTATMPSAGSHRSQLSQVASDITPHPHEAADDAEHRHGHVPLQLTGFDAAEAAGGAPGHVREPVQRAVDQEAVADVQEHAFRDPVERPAEHGVVELVDPVLAAEEAVQPREPGGEGVALFQDAPVE